MTFTAWPEPALFEPVPPPPPPELDPDELQAAAVSAAAATIAIPMIPDLTGSTFTFAGNGCHE